MATARALKLSARRSRKPQRTRSVFDRVKVALDSNQQPARKDLLEVCYRAEIAAEVSRFNVRLSPYMRAVLRLS